MKEKLDLLSVSKFFITILGVGTFTILTISAITRSGILGLITMALGFMIILGISSLLMFLGVLIDNKEDKK